MEPELAEQAIYSEFEDNLQIVDAETMTQWCQWVTHTATRNNLPYPAPDAWQVLIREAVRYTGEQDTLPLNPLWITRQFKEVAPLCEGETCNAEQFSLMLTQREWREGFLAERMQDEILQEQILIETEGERIGQINALSVIEFLVTPARLVSLLVSAVWFILATANLRILSAKPSLAEIFMRRV